MTTKKQIAIPKKLVSVFAPQRGELRYRGAYGGRGSGKSFTFALMAAVWAAREPLRVLCVRELQNSIKESFHAELKNAIESDPWLESCYTVGVDFIRGNNGSEFLFKGLRHNMNSVKSLAQIDLCIVEEAEDVPMASWQVLEPTIRAPKSEIWVVWNPRDRDSPVHKMFRENPPPRSKIVELNWSDNPKFPAVLDEQRKTAMQRLDPSTYAHIWEGAFYEQSEAQIFRGKYTIDEFTPTHLWDGPYYGMDFGFAVDPTTVVKCWVADNRLYIEQEAYKVGLELDDTTAYVKDRMDGIDKHTIRADNARPESISYLKRAGLYGITPCEKGKGSVMDGIEFIKSFEKVVIHPQCKHTQDEFRLYSYKTDRLSGDVLPMPLDSNNHIIDALRYALEPIMKTKSRNYGSML